jgi:hypothetical protein
VSDERIDDDEATRIAFRNDECMHDVIDVRLTCFIHERVKFRICKVSVKCHEKGLDRHKKRRRRRSTRSGCIGSAHRHHLINENFVQQQQQRPIAHRDDSSRRLTHLELRPGSFLLFRSIFIDELFSNLSKMFLLYSIFGPSSIGRILK